MGTKLIDLVDPRERRAAAWLGSLGHQPEKIPEESDKTPDFLVRGRDTGAMFYAEVKTLEGPGEGEPLLWDPLYNTIAKRIRDSRKQFESVDAEHHFPRVMLFLSEDMRIHGQTMLDFFKSRIEVGEQVVRDLNRFRFGRVRDDLEKIDLYVVLDIGDSPTFFFSQTDSSTLQSLLSLFWS